MVVQNIEFSLSHVHDNDDHDDMLRILEQNSGKPDRQTGIPRCYNKNFKISDVIKMPTLKQNNELTLCETGNFTKLYEHDLEHREKNIFPSLLPLVKRALEQRKLIISLWDPLGIHDFKTREMLHCFLFHLGNML